MSWANTSPLRHFSIGICATGASARRRRSRGERWAVDARGPEQAAGVVELLERERGCSQRHHLIKSRPAAQRLGVGEVQVIAGDPFRY